MRLRVKLALALVPLVVAPVVALGWLTWVSVQGKLEGQAERGMAVALMLADQGLSDLADGAAASAELLASAPEVRAATGPGADTAAAVRLFDRYRATYPDYLSIRLLDGAGGVLAQAAAIGFHGDLPLADPSAAEVAARAGPAPRFDLDANADLLRVYRVVQDPDAAAPGAPTEAHVVALSVALTPLYARLVTQHLGWSGALLLAQADGEVLYDSDRAMIAPSPSMLRETLGQLGTTLTPRRLDWGGEPSLVMARALREGLTAVAVQPLRGLSHPLDTLAVQTVAISFFSALLLVAVLFIWLRRLVLRPLKTLRSAARAIGTGRRVPPVTVRGDDELGLLGAELREMAERLGQYNEQIEQLAFYDQLTGLPNRNLIRDLLTQRMDAPRRADEVLALLFVDLDNFKQINDNLGHAVGDRVLQTVADRLQALLDNEGLEQGAFLARFGGDELLATMDRLPDANAAADLAARVLAAAAEPVELQEGHYVVTASAGIALYPQDAQDPDGLVRCADLAMYRAKSEGRNLYRFFSPELNMRASERLVIEHRLRYALRAECLTLQYQPIVALDTGRLVACEALLRWRDDELGPVSPARFIPIAEESGLIQDIGRWVLEAVCAQVADWRRQGLAPRPVAVNVSAAHVQREALAGPVAALLERYGLEPDALHLEITESVLMDLTPANSARVQALSDLGLAIHIDDFGTGYSSLNYLRRFAIDCIKIDRSFVANLCTRDEDRALATAMIAMAKALGLKIVAEGIEEDAQLALLRDLGCDFGQGYLFAKPMDPADFALVLARAAMAPLRAVPAEVEREAAG
jgi:diguanylate cyclase (GGDEF)-like protein